MQLLYRANAPEGIINKDKKIQKWESTRQKGKLRFILLYGVVFWGLGLAIVFPTIRSIFFNTQIELPELLSGIIGFPLIGAFWGLVMWHISETQYHNKINRHEDH